MGSRRYFFVDQEIADLCREMESRGESHPLGSENLEVVERVYREYTRTVVQEDMNLLRRERVFRPPSRTVPYMPVPHLSATWGSGVRVPLEEVGQLNVWDEEVNGRISQNPSIKRIVNEMHEKGDVVEIFDLVRLHDRAGTLDGRSIFEDGRALSWLLHEYVTSLVPVAGIYWVEHDE